MGSKYKSPLIRSRNTSATTVDASKNVENPPPAAPPPASTDELGDVLVYDKNPQPISGPQQHSRGRGGFGSPRFGSPRPRGSPYQWTPPSPQRFNNSWTPDRNNSGRYSSPNEQNSSSPYRPQFNKYSKRNSNNYSSCNNEQNSSENYFHPSMLEDPWAPLLNKSENNDNNKVF